MRRKKTIGILLTYKHATYIRALYQKLPKHTLDAIIISDDDSGDTIKSEAKALGIPVYRHRRLGYGGNMKFGIQKALAMGAEYIVEIHGDGQYDPSFITPAIKKMKQGYDVVLATRFIDLIQPLRDNMPMIKYLANIGLSFIQRLILGVWVSEFHTGARVYSKKAIKIIAIEKTSHSFLFGFEIIAQIAYHRLKIGEIPGRSSYDKTHTSISIPDSISYAIGTFGVLGQYVLARLGYRKTRLFGNG